MVSKYTLAIVAVTALIRILLVFLFPGLQRVADQSVEFSTPVTSYKSLLEGIFLSKKVGTVIDIYDGGVVHQTPLLIAFFQQIQTKYHYLVFILFDCLIAAQLITLTRRVNHTFKFINVGVWLPSLIHATNPIAMISCISNSSIIFNDLGNPKCSDSCSRWECLSVCLLFGALGIPLTLTQYDLYPII